MLAANDLAAAANGRCSAQAGARIGVNGQGKRDLVHALTNRNPESLPAPKRKPVAQERLLVLPSELEVGGAVSCIPNGYTKSSRAVRPGRRQLLPQGHRHRNVAVIPVDVLMPLSPHSGGP